MIPTKTLKFVQVFYTYGQLTPSHNYYAQTPQEQKEVNLWKEYIPDRKELEEINNLYKCQGATPSHSYDQVFDQISKKGIVQMQNVGEKLRKIYMEEEEFISDSSFNASEVSLHSPSNNNTLYSMQALLSSLFPIQECKSYHPTIKTNSDDSSLNKFDFHCIDEQAGHICNDEWKRYLISMKETYYSTVSEDVPYFKDKSKFEWNDVIDFAIRYNNHDIAIPQSIQSILPEILNHNKHRIAIICNSLKYLHCYFDDLFEMIKREVDAVNCGQQQTKLSIYSCDNIPILPFVKAISPYNTSTVPVVAANICLEYWENNSMKETEVAMRYNGEYQPLFVENTKDALTVSYKQFCKLLTLEHLKYLSLKSEEPVLKIKNLDYSIPLISPWDNKKKVTIEVRDEDNKLEAILQYKGDELNGMCKFFNKGILVKEIPYMCDRAFGWGYEYGQCGGVKRCFYDGSKEYELKENQSKKGYFDMINVRTQEILSTCIYDEEYRITGTGYDYQKGQIKEINLYKDGKEVRKEKEFNNDEMIEYDYRGSVVYKGEYLDSLTMNYPREGKGKEYNNGVIIYDGEWKNGKREGHGIGLMNGLVFYDGEWKNGYPEGKGQFFKNGKFVLSSNNWKEGRYELSRDSFLYYNSMEKKINEAIQA